MDSLIPQPPAEFRPTPPEVERKLRIALAEPDRVLFLDVETTGLSRYYDYLTVIGWSLDSSYEASLAIDLSPRLLCAVERATTLVTFNGTLFDIPFLRKTFPSLALPNNHIDLRYLSRRVGLVGGQKKIERELDINLRGNSPDVDGRVAVLLWHQYLNGDESSLRRLIEYNRADVLAMRHILDHVLDRLPLHPDLFHREHFRFSAIPIESSGLARVSAALPPAPIGLRKTYSFEQLFDHNVAEGRSVGIDLTGSGRRPSGWCLLEGSVATTQLVGEDQEIIEKTIAARPTVVSIDSPLSIPFGRNHVGDDDPARAQFGIMRQCERELKRRGINVYPCLLPSMQRLTERGIRLSAELQRHGIRVIECYPGAAQDIIGIPRKGAGLDLLSQGLLDFGLVGGFAAKQPSHDELDAITCALVGHFYSFGHYEALSGPGEGDLIIPRVREDGTHSSNNRD